MFTSSAGTSDADGRTDYSRGTALRVHAHGITLSPQQLELARTRIAQSGLEGCVTVELLDYRELAGEAVYDKVASVGMFEHVGLKNLPVYFSSIHRLFKPSGMFLNHGITHDVEGWEKTSSTEFINRYVFPDGQLGTVSNIQRSMWAARFEISDVEALRPHYALTLRHWVLRLQSHHAQALNYVNESTYRVWRFYMGPVRSNLSRAKLAVPSAGLQTWCGLRRIAADATASVLRNQGSRVRCF